jgi:hypothetical protein
VADIVANPTEGLAPLTVSFNGTGSTDADADPLTYRWDLDGDGALDDSTAASPGYTYTSVGTYVVTLEVNDGRGGVATDSVTIQAGGTSPTPSINTPSAGTTWAVGQTVNFSGSATDFQDGALPPSALQWDLILHHCPGDVSSCHEHPIQSWVGIASGLFVAPDHDYPAYLELRLTARDSDNFTATVGRDLQPRTVVLTFATRPKGLSLIVGGAEAQATTFSRTFIVGSRLTVSAPLTQTLGGVTYTYASWSDRGARTHEIVAPSTKKTYTATYRR